MVQGCLYLPQKQTKHCQSHPIPSCALLFLWWAWLNWRQNKQLWLLWLSCISCPSDYSLKKKKAFWNRQVDFFFLQVFFSFNWNNTLNWYLIIPPQYSLKMMRFAPDRMLNDYKTGILEIKNWCCFQSNTKYQLLLIDRAPCSFLLIKWLVSSYLLQWEYVSQGPFKMNI